MQNKIPVAILGATGMVGQRFVSLLANHPWFEIKHVAASSRSTGKTYKEAISSRWAMPKPIPAAITNLEVLDVEQDLHKVAGGVRLIFSAISADKETIRDLENRYAAADVVVVSNNSAHRWTPNVPMIMPEVNPEHLDIIAYQRQSNGWDKGLIVVKPNCSIQSYVPLLKAWEAYQPRQVIVSTYQAVSGAGKTVEGWPEMQDNVIPYIGGEEEKSEQEPLKIFAKIHDGQFINSNQLSISADCIRVPVSNGHLATIHVKFEQTPSEADLIAALQTYDNPIASLNLPSAPDPFITYFDEADRPQTRLDREAESGMGITAGRLRKDEILDYKCIGLSHNTIRGAAGGAVLIAEMLKAKGYLG